ncbi:MAG TPA: redoxin domain-containing protein [Kofleriaceae bacterium]|nr:redoxin domain-containing protein [Kofleriaceae bacterium]
MRRRTSRALPILVLALVPLEAAARPGQGPEPPWLGVGIADGARGVKITEVILDTPADRAGVREDDEILAIDRQRLTGARDLQVAISRRRSGERVRLDVQRGKRRLVLVAVLAPRLDEREVADRRAAAFERRLIDRAAPAFALPVAAAPGRAADAPPATVSLADLRGKVVVLEFLATWCGPCKSTYGTLSDLAARRRGDGLVVLGISPESATALAGLASRERIGFPLLRDVDSAARAAYRASATPTLIVIDRRGVVRYAGMGAGLTVDHAVFTSERLLDRRGGE